MATEIVVGYLSDNSKDVDVENECSSCCSVVGGIDSRSQSLLSHSSLPLWADDDLVNYCQYSDSEDDPLVECLTCVSWFELDTYCPGC
jgi:hypothetical protein